METNQEPGESSTSIAEASAFRVRQGRKASLSANLVLAIISIGFGFGLLELGSRAYYALKKHEPKSGSETTSETPLHILCDCPFLYRLNPDHPEISMQGLRDREYAIPALPDVQRVLVLGDSITYGVGVASEDTFPKKLEQSLEPVEVVNSGVQGYTAYNELQYYLNEGKQFQADLVVVAFSPNDVVNPRRHINYAPEAIKTIPNEAIPNLEYDRNHILPTLQAKKGGSPLDSSALYHLIESRLGNDISQGYAYQQEAGYTVLDGKKWPTFLTAEDTLSIQVLTDYQSAEWQWLRYIYDQLLSSVERKDSTGIVHQRLMIVMLPLAYQLDEDYPFLPQEQMTRYCAERSIAYLDLLPAFREHAAEKLYIDPSEGLHDIWHLTERGHQIVASELKKFITDFGLINPNPSHE